MNTALRNVAFVALLGTVLVFSGCATKTAHKAPQPVTQFSVVESSKGLVLTPQQLAELQKSVTEFLQGQGRPVEGQYFVKVNFTPDKPDDEGQWAVVRIDSYPSRTYTVLAAYPGPDDYYPYDAYGYYPSFAGYAYYDPFDYNYGYYHPPYPVTPPYHKPDHGPGGGHNTKPGDKPDHPTGTPAPTGWNGNRQDPDQPQGKYGNQPHNTGSQPHGTSTQPRNTGNQPHGNSTQPHNTGSQPHGTSTQPRTTEAQPHTRDYSGNNFNPAGSGNRNSESRAYAPTTHQAGTPHVYTPPADRPSSSSSSTYTPAVKDGTSVNPSEK